MAMWNRSGRARTEPANLVRRKQWRSAMSLEPLETRVCPSNMVWVNRGQATDNFATVFGANAEGARRVVDALLQSWGTVLQNLNQPPVNASADRNTINFTISMDTSRDGFGGGASITDYAYPSEEDRDANRNGYPVAGSITLDRGQPGQVNGGWWIDPTPLDSVEYTNILSPFAARPGPLVVGTDIYSTINAEIVHVLGLFGPPNRLQTPLNGSTITKLDLRDPQGNGSGFHYVFDGPSGTHLLTSYDSGGGGTDTGSATHSAPAEAANQPVAFNSRFRGAVQLRGVLDAGNATGGDARVLVSDNIAQLLGDAFGYTVRLPTTIPGFTYNVATQGRTLRINGGPDGDGDVTPASVHSTSSTASHSHVHHGAGPNFEDDGGTSADTITLRRDGDDLVISILLGRSGPVENFDAHDGGGLQFETRIPLADFDSIVIDDGAGDDNVVYDLSGGEFFPVNGITEDGDAGTDTVRIKVGAAGRQELVYRSTSTSSAVITLLPPVGSPPGTLPETLTVSSVNSVLLEGEGVNADGRTLFVDELVTTSATTAPALISTRLPVTQQGFDAVTILTANPVSLYRTYSPTSNSHFFTTSTGEFANAIANGFRDESANRASGFTVLPTPTPGAVPLYRLYNLQSGIHYLTTNAVERDQLVGLVPPSDPAFGRIGWRAESNEGYLFPTQMPGTVEIFHLYNAGNGAHLFTANPSEVVAILSQFPDDWKLNRSLGFAFPSGFHVTPPLPSATALAAPAVAAVTLAPFTGSGSVGDAALTSDGPSQDGTAGLVAVPMGQPLATAATSGPTSGESAGSNRVVMPAPTAASAIGEIDAALLAEFYMGDLGDVMDS
jgi:hypothetical protein